MSFSKAIDLLKLAMMASCRRGVCLIDIEAEFGCVRRTAQRMIDALEECFPATEHSIAYDGRHYWRLPARAIAALLGPTADELAAMSLAIEELDRLGISQEAGNLRTLSRKVRALVPAESGSRLAVDEEVLLQAMGYAARPGPSPSLNTQVDDAIAYALKGPFHLRIGYQSRAEEAPVERTVAPYGLLLGARRYLVAEDTAKPDGKLRHYRVEDVTFAEPLETSFEVPQGFSIAAYAQRAFGSFHNDAEFGEVAWKFSPRAAPRAKRYVFHPAQRLEELDDGSLVVTFEASGQLEMCWHLYPWGDSVEVLSPPELAQLVNEHRRTDFPALP